MPKVPFHIVSDAQGPMGIMDADGKAVAWFSDSFVPANGYAWKPEKKRVEDPDTKDGTTCYSARNATIRKILELLNDSGCDIWRE